MHGKMGSDWIGKIIGLVVFALGVWLLYFVFQTAHGLFNATPASALGLTFTGNPKTDPSAMALGQSFGFMLIKILLLFLMGVSGSLIAQKGINFYASASQPALHSSPAPTPEAG